MADLSTLTATFDVDYASAALVNANTQFTGCYGTVSTSSGTLVVLCDTTFNHGGKSAENYTWNGTGFYFKPTGAPEGSAATNQYTYLAIFDASSTDDSIRIGFDIDRAPTTPTITCIAYSTDGTYTDVTGTVSETYVVGSNHAWLGWYMDTTNLYYVRSSDGNSWTTMRTLAKTNVTWLSSQSDLGFSIAPNRVGGSNTNALLDNVNSGGTPPGAVTARTTPMPFTGMSKAVMRASTR